jgi:hypothetical protein
MTRQPFIQRVGILEDYRYMYVSINQSSHYPLPERKTPDDFSGSVKMKLQVLEQ